jgi:hypothetical protein
VILPYNEVTRWDYENVNAQEKTIINRKGKSIAPLAHESFHRIYKFSKPLTYMSKDFLETFAKENPSPLEILQD